MKIEFNLRSRYARGTRAYYDSETGQYWLSPREIIEAPKRSDDQYHTVVDGDRIDNIAYDYLGDPFLFWVIMDYAMRDGKNIPCPLDLTKGLQLRIPSVTYVHMRIVSRR